MKTTLRVPTEKYAFVEVEVDIDSIAGIKDKYDEIQNLFDFKEGLDKKKWNHVLDYYLTNGTMSSEEYNDMSSRQQRMIQEIKKAFKRINKEPDEDNNK